MTLESTALSYRVGNRTLLNEVSIQIRPGRIHAILGPNGAGKSTLLKLLAGELTPSSGQARLDASPLSRWAPGALAQRRAVMQQQDELRFGFQVEDVLALGRLPWAESRRLSQPLIEHALTQFHLQALRARRYTELSGGERARVQLARTCLQLAGSRSPSYLLLDEPFASLDLAYRIRCQEHLTALARQRLGVAAVVHEPTTALNWADDCSLLRHGTLLASGPVEQVMTESNLFALYGLPLKIACSDKHIHKTVIPADI